MELRNSESYTRLKTESIREVSDFQTCTIPHDKQKIGGYDIKKEVERELQADASPEDATVRIEECFIKSEPTEIKSESASGVQIKADLASAAQIINKSTSTVQYIIKNGPLKFSDKLSLKQRGRPTPDIQINSITTSKTRTYNRQFNRNIYEKYKWMCGCEVTNKLFCFFCLLLGKESSPWIKGGVDDLKHIAERAKKHETSVSHLNASVDYNVLGKIDIREQLSSAYLQLRQRHNENVDKNRHILCRLIMCIKFCGAFELALRGHDKETTSDNNRGVYLGLIDFAAELDSVLAIHMKEAEIFKGTSEKIQNELLDAMYEVYRNEVAKQMQSANFIAIEADETTDASNQRQMVVMFRYVLDGQICERFWSFIRPTEYSVEILSTALLEELQNKLSVPCEKLIAQSYDGASVMSDRSNGVQSVIRTIFPNAYFVHCYAHEFNLILERAAQSNKMVKLFFANVQAFSSFFSRSPKRTAFLDDIVKRKLPWKAPTRWNFESRTVNTLYENKDAFKECLEKIIDGDELDSKTLNEASGLLNSLNSPEFLYWLKVFHFITPHVKILFNQTEGRGIDSAHIQKSVEQFAEQMRKIRNCTDNIVPEIKEEPDRKRQKPNAPVDGRSAAAKEVCDAILAQIEDRFDFKDHLCAAKLFEARNFKSYRRVFPQNYFDATVASYSMLNGAKLKSELTVIYNREDMCGGNGILSLLTFVSENDLKDVLSETYKLLDIICTTPMSTSEYERCFSTLRRIKTFLRSTMAEDRLNALAVLSVEKKFIQSIPDFDNKVIEVFCKNKDRRTDLLYK